MRLKVTAHMGVPHDYHECEDLDTNEKLRVDLKVSGKFPVGTTNESLVGNTYEVMSMHPFLFIADEINPEPIE